MNIDNHSLFVQDHWVHQRPLVGRSRRAVRAGEGRCRPATSRASTPAASCRVSASAYDISGNGNHIVPRHVRPVLRPLQRGADRRQQPGRQPGGHLRRPTGARRSGARISRRASNLANYPITPANASVADPLQNVFIEDGAEVAAGRTSSRTSYGDESGRRSRLRGGELHLPQDDEHDRGLPGHDDRHDQRRRGRASTPATFTNIVYRNTDLAWRQYQALVFQSPLSQSEQLHA